MQKFRIAFVSFVVFDLSNAQVNTKDLMDAFSDLKYPAGFQEGLNTGMKFVVPGQKGTINLGLVTLPANFLCSQPNSISTIACHICSIDCQYIHNKYGGTCGVSNGTNSYQNNNQKVCKCFDNPPKNGKIPTAVKTCGPIFGDPVDKALDVAIKNALKAREFILQCNSLPNILNGGKSSKSPKVYAQSGGCSVDCYSNHQYRTGTCTKMTAVPTSKGKKNKMKKKPFCYCSY